MTISGNVYFVPNSPNPVNTGANLEFGFSSSVNSNSNYGPGPLTTFTGLQLFGDGSIQEYVGGAAVGSPIAFVGTFSAATPTAFSYDINTATGAISNVSLAGSTATYNFATSNAFANADTAYAELGGTANDGGGTANFQSFELRTAAVPEPASLSLLAIGGLALGMRRRRKTASSAE